MIPRWMTAVPLVLLGGCASLFPRDVPEEAPPLTDMEEPLALHEEPDDEALRAALPLGAFTGIVVKSARRSLDDMEPESVEVKRVIENSPGDAAGIREGDLLLEAVDPSDGVHALRHASAWRKLELDAKAGDMLEVIFDRAGIEGTAYITVTQRVRRPGRTEAQRFREERKAGLVLRTATEVEARGAGLGPGGGAVIVGLSQRSPWRVVGLRFGDLITTVDDKPVTHPQVVLDALRDADTRATLAVAVVRGEERFVIDVPVTERAAELSEFSLPPLVHYENDRGSKELSFLLGLVRHRTTAVAWEWRLLWLFRFAGGEADELVDVEEAR